MSGSLTRSHKSGSGALAGLVALALTVPGCGKENAGLSTSGSGDRSASAARTSATTPIDDWGGDWADASRDGRSSRTGGMPEGGTTWSIVLATFPAGTDRRAPANTVAQLQTIAPQLTEVWIHKSDKGSLVLHGHYEGAGSEDAQADLQKIKAISLEGRPVFFSAYLSRISLGPALSDLHPHALLSIRQRYPTLDPLYTLEVAVWGDFESGELTLKQIHKAAEDYTAQLRVQGYEAYFFHDNDKRLSMVTVGLFDQRAIDTRSGLLSPEVDALKRRFPSHMVNGEQLLEPIDGRNPHRGTRVQQPMLVMVPKR